MIARPDPSQPIMASAMVRTDPLSFISLAKIAPSRKSGKNWARKPAAATMKIWVQLASIG